MLGIGEEHTALHETVRRWCAERCPPEVAREHMERDEPGRRPPVWDELADQGWLGLHLPEELAGSGYGLVEAAIVLEELGRGIVPGPALPTIAASSLLAASGAPPETVRALADGTRTGAVALAPDLTATPDGDGHRLDGEVRPVLGGAAADVLVLGARTPDGDELWAAVRADDLGIAPLDALDATRDLAAVTADGTVVTAEQRLDGLTTQDVVDRVGVLTAAEAAGIAGWCVDTTAEYAQVREQFGRPIGSFQAVKHQLADLLIATEQARAVAWDAARSSGEELALTAAIARALAPGVAVAAGKGAIQLHGGIGFTWEHDAHLYLKRALAVRQLLGGAAGPRGRVAELALAGRRRELEIELPPAADAVRAEAEELIAEIEDLPSEERRTRLGAAGYLAPHYPEPWGRDADAVEQLAIDQAFAEAGMRRPSLAVGGWALPTLIAHGTDQQRKRFIEPTLRGELTWCQMFSEPEAGSDLASLTTRAERVDGGWELTGQKVWTSLAEDADYAICLARTDPDAPKHDGITYFIVDMDAEGLDVRPLTELTGDTMFNEVFLDDVFVPDDQVVGEVDGGWAIARDTLSHERVAMSRDSAFGGGLESVLAALEDHPRRDDPLVLDELGRLLCEAQSVALLDYRQTVRSVAGSASGGGAAAVAKLLGVEHAQRVSEFALELLGPAGAVAAGTPGRRSHAFLFNRCLTIAGGTSEVQRNIIGERALGLPRDPERGG